MLREQSREPFRAYLAELAPAVRPVSVERSLKLCLRRSRVVRKAILGSVRSAAGGAGRAGAFYRRIS